MRYRVTPQAREIVQRLHHLAAEIGPYIPLASPAARAEWTAFQATWPSEIELRQGWISISEEDLDADRARIRRFGQILRQIGGHGSGQPSAPRDARDSPRLASAS